MKKDKIVFLPLMGRIGNQLFEYAFAYALQRELGEDTKLIIDESEVDNLNWINSLKEYDLPNVVYIQNKREVIEKLKHTKVFLKIYNKLIRNSNPQIQYKREKRWQRILNRGGLVAVEKGYAHCRPNTNRSVYMFGYFQSESFFRKYATDIKRLYDLSDRLDALDYPGIDEIKEHNTVCISIKIEHNLGSSIYDICNEEYYRKAIEFILQKVDNPLFFLCSDNVDKAREVFFNDFDGDVICQAKEYSAAISLCAMSKCKHFIINNTSFGWWAQYLCDYEKKIVIAPDKWMRNDDPVSIYDEQIGWHLISCN